jgi:hypothetical protein
MIVDRLGHLVTGGMVSWYEAKMFIEHASVISSDAIHLLVGVLIWLIAAQLSRRTLSAWLPWLVVLALALLNEAVDLSVEHWPSPGMQLGESAKDVMLTMALPTLLMAVLRLRPNLFRSSPRRR